MGIKSISCPNCGTPLKAPENVDIVTCPSCEASVAVREQLNINVKHTANINHLLSLAEVAFNGGNCEEAYDYATKVLEYDSDNAYAWRLKGMSAAYMSTFVDNRIIEAIQAFKMVNACNVGEGDIVEDMHKMGEFLNDFAKHSFEQLTEKKFDIISHPGGDDIYRENLCYISMAYGCANVMKPDDINIMKNYVEFNRKYISMLPSSPEKKELMEENEELIHAIKKKQPHYSPQRPSNSSDCFVVTATLGNEYHPRVIIMREFRDNILKNYALGNSFIEWYYNNGPKLALIISRRRLYKHIAFVLVVFPVSEIVKILQSYRKR